MGLKDPGARTAHGVDWGAAYLGTRAITASSWSVAPEEEGGIAILSQSQDFTTTSVVIEGGRPGHVYRLTNRVTMTDGTSDERALVLRVEER